MEETTKNTPDSEASQPTSKEQPVSPAQSSPSPVQPTPAQPMYPPMPSGYASMYPPAYVQPKPRVKPPKSAQRTMNLVSAITYTVIAAILIAMVFIPFSVCVYREYHVEYYSYYYSDIISVFEFSFDYNYLEAVSFIMLVLFFMALVALPLLVWLRFAGKKIPAGLTISLASFPLVHMIFNLIWQLTLGRRYEMPGPGFYIMTAFTIAILIMEIVVVVKGKKAAPAMPYGNAYAPAAPYAPTMPYGAPPAPAAPYAVPTAPYTPVANPYAPPATPYAPPAPPYFVPPTPPVMPVQPTQPTQAAFCAGCGTALAPNTTFCPRCGRPITINMYK